MNYSEQPPSTQWAALKYRGEKFAEVWFKPQGEPLALTLRIPQGSFQIPGLGPLLTPENLLKAVGIVAEEVESWRRETASRSGREGSHSELGIGAERVLTPGKTEEVRSLSAKALRDPLPPPPAEVAHLYLYVSLKPPPQEAAPPESCEPEIPEAKWQQLEARWKAILDLEASMETLRMSMESLRVEMEASSSRMLTTEEKVNALNADVVQWNKAKSRVIYALPKVREFIHRSIWAPGTPEKKKLQELFKDYIEPRIPFPRIDQVMELLENLMKDRKILSAQGVSAYHECKNISAYVQGTLRTLQNNSAANAAKKKRERGGKLKSFEYWGQKFEA